MRERPILFSGPMVRAILDGRKTQTRRVIALPRWAVADDVLYMDEDDPVWPNAISGYSGCMARVECPYGAPGDRLWVRETWQAVHWREEDCEVPEKIPTRGGIGHYFHAEYAAEPHPAHADDRGWPWRPAIHMPRWASRLTLEIADVRVQRLQEISEEDALAEGAAPEKISDQDVADMQISDAAPFVKEMAKILGPGQFTAKFGFQSLWDSINAERGFAWKENPWVWALTFRPVAPSTLNALPPEVR